MLQEKLSKFSMLIQAIKLVRNWYLIVLLYLKIVKNDNVVLNLRNGFKIKLRTNETDLHQFTNVWLKEEYKVHDLKINRDDVVIDIGAHIGLFAIYVAAYCKEGKIFCFEPIKDNYDLLVENIRLNGIRNIIYFNSAVSSHEGKIPIYLNKDSSAHSIYFKEDTVIEVYSTSLKEIIDSNKITDCNLLKMDCEGAEYEIINSIPDNYFEIIANIFLEYHLGDTKNDFNELKDCLKKHDFKIEIKPTSNNLGILFARKINVNSTYK